MFDSIGAAVQAVWNSMQQHLADVRHILIWAQQLRQNI